MYLKFEFFVITNESCLRDARSRLREEYDFAYSPFIPGQQKIFREIPDMEGYNLPVKVLLFKYVPEDPDGGYKDNIAVQDIVSGLEYLGVMGWDTSLWEWTTCSETGEVSGYIPIQYKYVAEGDDSHIYYEVAEDKQKEEVLVTALESIIEQCNLPSYDGETQDEFADRIELMAARALNTYEQRRL